MMGSKVLVLHPTGQRLSYLAVSIASTLMNSNGYVKGKSNSFTFNRSALYDARFHRGILQGELQIIM
jgi:hypothetical protein